MTDLTGAELELEVARVMGNAALDHCLNRYGYADLSYFSPLKDGFDTWEVHQWLRAQGWGLEFLDINPPPPHTQREVIIRCYKSPDSYAGVGPDDATALCRAVVAMGGGDD